jgi:formate--tetrahydrofolate ligase
MSDATVLTETGRPRPIAEVAQAAGIHPDDLEVCGPARAKVRLSTLDRLASRPNGKLVIVTAITPTQAGEGKTTSSIALVQGLGLSGRRVMLCVRQPSMGPVFGIKGGGTGGGRSLLVPMEEINLHLNGDFHAVAAAHNLLAAALDASIFHGNPLEIDPATVVWPRTVDMNDRQLRYVTTGLGGRTHGVPRDSQFVITAASEVMAVLALARDVHDLRRRLGRIVVASDRSGAPITAEHLKVAGAMTVIMKHALLPNLVQTMEGQPALVHAGPFGNIAHGANSILASRVALKLADIVVTEAGFASDLGFQKFCDIVCPAAAIAPNAAVLVVTGRAVKSHGGVPVERLGVEDMEAVRLGMANVAAHIEIVGRYGLPCVVAINRFASDTRAELDLLAALAVEAGARTVVEHDGFMRGGEGALAFAEAVAAACEEPSNFTPLSPPGTPVEHQVEAIATRVYGADGVDLRPAAAQDLARIRALGLGTAPVCMAKTHLSLSHDPMLRNRPKGFVLPVRGFVASAGAGFVVALCGDMQRMPGLGRTPAFTGIDIDAAGNTVGLT